MNMFNTSVRRGRAVSFDRASLTLTVQEDGSDRTTPVHWTSYHSVVPGLVPARGEAIDLIYVRRRGGEEEFLFARPAKK